ncbi:hypothetical protein HDU67_007421 [Dinochytrium kinnereticum]|nr:hypothetical protein HDU67_007421 [Dinochytrium kinnereticum]
MRFRRFLEEIVETELKRERERGFAESFHSGSKTFASPTGSSSKPAKPKARRHNPTNSSISSTPPTHLELTATLTSAIQTMTWISIVLIVFLLYSVFSAMVVVYLGEANFVYYLTLAFHWWAPTGLGSGIFAIVLVRRWRQAREGRLWEEEGGEQGKEGGGKAGGMELRLVRSGGGSRGGSRGGSKNGVEDSGVAFYSMDEVTSFEEKRSRGMGSQASVDTGYHASMSSISPLQSIMDPESWQKADVEVLQQDSPPMGVPTIK